MGTTKLTQALLKNSKNPKLAWQLFKRIQSSPTNPSFLPSVPTIARILITAKMLPEIDHLHRLLLSSQPQQGYQLFVEQLLVGGQLSEAKLVFEAALNRSFYLGGFLYKDLIEKLCKDEKLEEASEILHKMIKRGYKFDPASFMPVVDELGKRGHKHEADELAEKMMEMASDGRKGDKIYPNARESIRRKGTTVGADDWHTIVHRDDGSGIALKALKRVQKGWGQRSVSHLQPHKNEFLDHWESGG
ncbi:hypothetical protein CCACVL1_13260 [Corchorus capsularis]|uniref:Pentatricopeptide repeat-containing protein n=1 Tax=Corchorus capsularis TaxID=210143 RepID=A0A1R3IBN1_COCAP|nr:hypothetical protein CCACVL1_13260 [Corchorus capsularis]